MLTKWFGSRSSRLPQRDRRFRPELEFLEGRFAPSNLVPMDPGNGHGHGHGNGNGNDNGHHGNGNGNNNVNGNGFGNINQAGNVHNNIHITNSFNNASNSFNNVATLAGAGYFSPVQTGSLGVLFAASSLLTAQTSNTSLGMLINDEIALAVDNYLLAQPAVASSSLAGSLSTNAAALNGAIGSLEGTVIGQLVGTAIYDLTSTALTVAGPKF